MIFNDLQNRFARRRQYKRLVAEIDTLTPRDLTDIRADRSELLYRAYQQVYG